MPLFNGVSKLFINLFFSIFQNDNIYRFFKKISLGLENSKIVVLQKENIGILLNLAKTKGLAVSIRYTARVGCSLGICKCIE